MNVTSMVAMLAALATFALVSVSAQASPLDNTTTEICQTNGNESYCRVVDQSDDEDDEPDILGLLSDDSDED